MGGNEDSESGPTCTCACDHMHVHVQYTEYRNGYSKDHPVIILFWEVFDAFSDELKKKFLSKLAIGVTEIYV